MDTKEPAKRNRDTNRSEKQQSGRNESGRQQGGGHGGEPPGRTDVRHPERSGSLEHDPEPGRSDYFKI